MSQMHMKDFGTKVKKLPWRYICPVLTIILFFSFCAILTYDSGHYLSYVSIIEGNAPSSSWDIVRGPIFPFIIYFFNLLFGKTNTGLLIGLFLYYLIFSFSTYKLTSEITNHYKYHKLIQNLIVIILIFNPLIFGYFHVLLTEFVAITLTILNLLIAYKWIFIKETNKKTSILYSVYFVVNIIFCYHLKQPYFIISFVPLLISAIVSIVNNHKKANVIYRLLTVLISLIFLVISIFVWDKTLDLMNADKKTGRDSTSMLGQQLLLAYQIPYDNNNDGKNDQLSTAKAIELIIQEFSKNPFHITKIYLQNYCGLTSMCEITTPNGYDFYSTSNLVGLSTYENTFIGYATYRNEDNISPMKKEMAERASAYASPTNKSTFTNIMNQLIIPANLLFKIATLLPLPTLVVLLFLKHKGKKKNKNKTESNNQLFYLSLLLLITSCSHLFVSAGVGLIIDRYAIEVFVPSLLGIVSTITYGIAILSKKQPSSSPVYRKAIKQTKRKKLIHA